MIQGADPQHTSTPARGGPAWKRLCTALEGALAWPERQLPCSNLYLLRMSVREQILKRELLLATQMLHVAEAELHRKDEQLDITVDLLTATERELQLKEEQLALVSALLRRADTELHDRFEPHLEAVPRSMSPVDSRRQPEAAQPTASCAASDSVASPQAPSSPRPQMPEQAHTNSALCCDARVLYATAPRVPLSAIKLGPPQLRQLAKASADANWQHASGRKAELARGDAACQMAPKAAVRCRHSVVDYVKCRNENPRLPMSHTPFAHAMEPRCCADEASCLARVACPSQ